MNSASRSELGTLISDNASEWKTISDWKLFAKISYSKIPKFDFDLAQADFVDLRGIHMEKGADLSYNALVDPAFLATDGDRQLVFEKRSVYFQYYFIYWIISL